MNARSLCLVVTLLAVSAAAPLFAQTAASGTGPYAVTIETDATLPTHTIYRPSNMMALGPNLRLPIVAWANGACNNFSRSYVPFLSEIASHGFLVIAIGPIDGTGNDTKPSQLLDAVDWATAQNGRRGSPYAGRIATTKVAVMGHSCGGLEALEVATDPRVTTAVLWNSGVLNNPTGAPAMPVRVTKATLDQLHAPIAYFIGGKGDVAYPNAADDFARITRVPALLANIDVGHGATYGEPSGGVMGVAGVAWLKWQLKGDAAAQRMFTGDGCGLCTDSRWTIERKLTPAGGARTSSR